ncbi:transmembrane protein, putative [Actinidia rufa]|uniref:Transmembrane protein, putative n=1 Tax=Actinidia rufa TaxID=165716 RepID=A0A7J0E628_9ERIC|nr:transmembrane protein, putative [Actinidia rufa]
MQPNGGADYVSIRIGKKLTHLSPSPSECCIFRVHKQLGGVNQKAYEPEIVAIGPYHRGKSNLQMMEEHKLRYLQLLLQRKNEINAERYVIAIRSLEQEARRCYAEPINLTSNQMVEMMLLDGCFIIELMRKFEMAYLREKNDPIYKMDWTVNSLQRDLMLFENQLPFFILCKLFDIIEVPNQHKRLIYLALCFFRDLLPGPGCRESVEGQSNSKISHLLGLIHNNWLPSFVSTEPKGDLTKKKWYRHFIPNRHSLGLIHNPSFVGTEPKGDLTKTRKNRHFIPNTTVLREAGVKLKKVEDGTLFDIKFKNGVMQIPSLTIEDRTESFFRNLIAYEQYCPDNQLSYITDYIRFVDCLIDSPKDVAILSRCGIIDNWLGDDEVVSRIFNRISDAVTMPSNQFQYADIFNKVNVHCSRRRNRWMAKLNRNYLNSPWAIISVLAALILLLLTATQTYFTIFPRHN